MPASIWLTVDDVAGELRIPHRSAWELVKKLGVPVVGPFRARSKLARFRRADWDAALARSLQPVLDAPEDPAEVAPAPSPRTRARRAGATSPEVSPPVLTWRDSLRRREEKEAAERRRERQQPA